MPLEVHDALAQARAIVEKALAAGRPALDEAAAKQVLAAYGVPVPAGGLVHSAPEAAELAASLGVPVAMKAVGALIQHKTETQLVVLGLRTPDEVAQTYVALAERAGDALEAVLVEEMVAGSRELMVGMKRDAAFGPVVAFGLGGTMTEVFRDIVLAVSPGSEGDVAELPDLIRGKALLGAFRGQPAVDRAKLVAIIEAVARIAADHPEIAEIDVNPLLVRDGEPVAADALMVLSAAAPPAAAARDFTPNLDAVLAPRSVAIVGASDNVTRWGGSALQNILAGGFEGAIYPINPKGGEFFGLPVSTSLEDVPAPPDLALLAVGAKQLEPVIAECGTGRRQGRRGHRRRLLRDRVGRRRSRARPRADGRRRRSHAHRPQLHGHHRQRDAAARDRLHRPAPAPRQAGHRVAVGQPGRPAVRARRPARPGRALLHRRGQRGPGERRRRARVPRRRRRDLLRADVSRGHRRRPPPLRGRARDESREAGGGPARRPHRQRRQGRRVAHRRDGRLRGRLRSRRPPGRPGHLHLRPGGARPHHGARAPAAAQGPARRRRSPTAAARECWPPTRWRASS